MPLSKFGRKHERTFGREKEEWDGDFRKPPKPKSYWTKIKGQCRWCGMTIVKDDGSINERRSWHEDCATLYMIVYHSREQRAQLRRRDGGVCNHCGKNSEQKGLEGHELDWSYYMMENLQTLCKSCHRKKTNSEVHLKKIKKNVKNNFIK